MTTRQPTDPSADTESPSERFVYQADPEQSLSEAVVVAVAKQSAIDDVLAVADEYGPLYDAIDPSALDSLFDSSGARDRSDGAVTFVYADRCVTVDTTGRVELTPLE